MNKNQATKRDSDGKSTLALPQRELRLLPISEDAIEKQDILDFIRRKPFKGSDPNCCWDVDRRESLFNQARYSQGCILLIKGSFDKDSVELVNALLAELKYNNIKILGFSYTRESNNFTIGSTFIREVPEENLRYLELDKHVSLFSYRSPFIQHLSLALVTNDEYINFTKCIKHCPDIKSLKLSLQCKETLEFTKSERDLKTDKLYIVQNEFIEAIAALKNLESLEIAGFREYLGFSNIGVLLQFLPKTTYSLSLKPASRISYFGSILNRVNAYASQLRILVIDCSGRNDLNVYDTCFHLAEWVLLLMNTKLEILQIPIDPHTIPLENGGALFKQSYMQSPLTINPTLPLKINEDSIPVLMNRRSYEKEQMKYYALMRKISNEKKNRAKANFMSILCLLARL